MVGLNNSFTMDFIIRMNILKNNIKRISSPIKHESYFVGPISLSIFFFLIRHKKRITNIDCIYRVTRANEIPSQYHMTIEKWFSMTYKICTTSLIHRCGLNKPSNTPPHLPFSFQSNFWLWCQRLHIIGKKWGVHTL